MKKLFTLIFIISGSYMFAQGNESATGLSFRLNGYATYAFDDNRVDSYYSSSSYFEGKVKGGFQYGGGLEILPFPKAGIEIFYLRLDSNAPIYYWDYSDEGFVNFDLAQNWLMLSFNKYLPLSPRFEPYGGAQVGMNIINVEDPESLYTNRATKLAWGFKLGLNAWANDVVGIKLQASLLSTVQGVGGGLYFGTGGVGAGLSAYSSYYQFNIGGGLVFKTR